MPGGPHWWDTVFTDEEVQRFLDEAVRSKIRNSSLPKRLVLTVAVPEESGPLHGFQIRILKTPGRIGRLKVTVDEVSIAIKTVNVFEYSFEIPAPLRGLQVITDGVNLNTSQSETALLISERDGRWNVSLDLFEVLFHS